MFPHMNHRPAHLLKPGVFLTVWTGYPLVLDGEAGGVGERAGWGVPDT